MSNSSASANRQEQERKDRESSYMWFLGTCAAITLTGVIIGVRRQLKREKFTFVMKEHQSSAILAFKALFYGTAICAGTFTAGTIAVSKAYDLKTPEDFAEIMKKNLSPLFVKTPEFVKDEESIKGMSESEELDYWSKQVPDANESSDNDVDDSSSTNNTE